MLWLRSVNTLPITLHKRTWKSCPSARIYINVKHPRLQTHLSAEKVLPSKQEDIKQPSKHNFGSLLLHDCRLLSIIITAYKFNQFFPSSQWQCATCKRLVHLQLISFANGIIRSIVSYIVLSGLCQMPRCGGSLLALDIKCPKRWWFIWSLWACLCVQGEVNKVLFHKLIKKVKSKKKKKKFNCYRNQYYFLQSV